MGSYLSSLINHIMAIILQRKFRDKLKSPKIQKQVISELKSTLAEDFEGVKSRPSQLANLKVTLDSGDIQYRDLLELLDNIQAYEAGKITILQMEIDDLKKKQREVYEAAERDIESICLDSEDMADYIDRLEAKFSDFQLIIKDLINTNEEFNADINDLNLENIDRIAKITTLSNSCRDLEAHIEDLNDDVERLEDLNEELEEVVRSKDETISKVQTLRDELKEALREARENNLIYENAAKTFNKFTQESMAKIHNLASTKEGSGVEERLSEIAQIANDFLESEEEGEEDEYAGIDMDKIKEHFAKRLNDLAFMKKVDSVINASKDAPAQEMDKRRGK